MLVKLSAKKDWMNAEANSFITASMGLNVISIVLIRN